MDDIEITTMEISTTSSDSNQGNQTIPLNQQLQVKKLLTAALKNEANTFKKIISASPEPIDVNTIKVEVTTS